MRCELHRTGQPGPIPLLVALVGRAGPALLRYPSRRAHFRRPSEAGFSASKEPVTHRGSEVYGL